MNFFKWMVSLMIRQEPTIYNYEEIKNKKCALHNELVHTVLIKQIAKEIVDNIIKETL